MMDSVVDDGRGWPRDATRKIVWCFLVVVGESEQRSSGSSCERSERWDGAAEVRCLGL
jgi:hypothetical protein